MNAPHTSGDDCGTPLAFADDVRVEFGDLVAVRNISLTLRAGDLVGLIGPNGAGKTTLMRAMAGLQPPTTGRSYIVGQDIFTAPRELRKFVGFAPDSPPVYEELTIQDFLMFIAYAYGLSTEVANERIEFWLEQVWLSEKRNEKIKNLSRGMRQRVTVARTLVPNPVVVLLDEPSAGLDPAGRIQFRKVLASLRDQGKGLIVSSHILADLEEYCTHIAIIERGMILRYGRVSELHDRDTGRRRYTLTLDESGDEIGDKLSSLAGVTDVGRENGVWSLEYDDGDERAAELLRSLIDRGIRVTSFRPDGKSLEQVYLDAGVRQVD